MNNEFYYLIDKIKETPFIEKPFEHIEIKNFLNQEHLNMILNEKQIHFEKKKNQDDLYNTLIDKKWDILHFPGCTTSWKNYKKYLKGEKITNYLKKNPIENIGITFRLHDYKNSNIKDLIKFMNGNEFHEALKTKFEINDVTSIISAIQKNLTGYEISPHPDKRSKALTYLLNINCNPEIEKMNCHTHLLEFKNKYKKIEKYWLDHPDTERCWVPWEWCNSKKTTNENNSFLIFKPQSEPASLHAILLDYDHLKFQRTQIYGNLMYKTNEKYIDSSYTDLML